MRIEAPDQAFAGVGEVIAANLRQLRTARRMSLATLAARADVAKATLANLEQGRGNPTIETLWSLALGLGVAFSDLLEDRRRAPHRGGPRAPPPQAARPAWWGGLGPSWVGAGDPSPGAVAPLGVPVDPSRRALLS